MLQRTARILSPFDEILLSANTLKTAAHLPLTAAPDRYAESLLPCQVFFNMNTPTDYDAVIGKRK